MAKAAAARKPRDRLVRRHRTPDEWRKLLSDAASQGWSIAELFRRTGISAVTIRKQSKAHGITLPRASCATKGIDWPAELKRAQRHGLTLTQLAAQLKLHPSSIIAAQKRLGVQLARGKGGGPACADWRSALQSALAAGETQSELSRRLAVPRQTVSLAAKRLGIALADGRAPRAKPTDRSP